MIAATIRLGLVSLVVLACDVSDPIRFGSDAGTGACPAIFVDENRNPQVDNSCGAARCTASAIEGGCAFSLSLESCESTELRGVVADNGDIVFAGDSTAGTCHQVTSARGALFSAECNRPSNAVCRLDVYPAKSPPFVEPRTLELHSVDFHAPPLSDRSPLLLPYAGHRGYIASVARFPDTIVAVTFDGRYDGVDCTSDQPTRSFFISATEFSIRSSTTTPPCLTRIARDDAAGAYLGVYGGRTPHLARFGPTGAMIYSRALTVTSSVGIVSDLVVDDDFMRIYLVWSSAEHQNPAGMVTVHDLVTFEETGRSEVLPTFFVNMDYTREGQIAVAGETSRSIEVFDAETAGYIGGFSLRNIRAVSDRPSSLGLHRESGFLLVAVTSDRPAISVLDVAFEDPIVHTAIDFEGGGTPFGMNAYRDEATLMVIGLVEPAPSYRARVALFDPVAGRFLPGSVDIGQGVVSELVQVQNSGDLVAVLPWSAELVRLAPN